MKQGSEKKKITNNDHIKFLNNLGGGGVDGAKFRTNYTRKKKTRVTLGKKAIEDAKDEESEEEDPNATKH